MADDTSPLNVALDPGSINPYGANQTDIDAYNQSLEDLKNSIAHRYDQPNWFQIAAGFAKPQLGGFLASLGSASQAYGQQVENQRQSVIDAAKIAAQQKQAGILLGQKRQAADLASGPQSPSTISEISNLDLNRGKALVEAQQARAATVANNLKITEAKARAAGQPMPSVDEMGLPMQGSSTGSPAGNTALPNGSNNAPTPSIVPSYKDTWGDTPVADVRNLINKMPNGEDKNAAQIQLNQQINQDNKPNQKQTIASTFDIGPTNPYENVVEANKDVIAGLNSEGMKYRETLGSAADTLNHATAMRPINNLEQESQDPRFDNVMAVLSGQGLMSGLATFVQHGIDAGVAGQHVSLSIPVDQIALAIKDPKDQAFAQEVYRNLALMALNNQRAAGVNASTARNAELGVLSSAAAHPETLPSAARYYIRESNLIQNMKHDMFVDNTNLITNKHPSYSLAPNSPTKIYEAQNSPSQAQIVKSYEAAIAKERTKFLNQSSGVK